MKQSKTVRTGNALGYAALVLLIATVFLWAEVLSMAHAANDESSLSSGTICLAGGNSAPRKFLASMMKSGASIKRFAGNDDTCGQFGDGYNSAFSVPSGLETWTVNRASRLGYSTRYLFSTAGGSGYLRNMVDGKAFFGRTPTPSIYTELRTEVGCKVSSVLLQNFKEVIVRPCSESQFNSEMCYQFWIGGHSSSSEGLRPGNFSNMIDSGYWISSRLEVWVGSFIQEGSWKAQIGSAVLSTKLARMPESRKPTASDFHTIEHFEPSINIDSLDERLNEVIANLLDKDRYSCI